MASHLATNQILDDCYDQAGHKLRVDATVSIAPGAQEVIISQTDDSIRLGDGVDLITATTVGPKVGLDVNIAGGVVSGDFTASGLSTGLKTQAVIIADTATKIPATALADRNGMSVRVWGNNTVYFGSSTVTVANGYPKRQNEEIVIDIKDNAAVELYGICDTGLSCEVRVIEIA